MIKNLIYTLNRTRIQWSGWIKSHNQIGEYECGPIDFVVTWVDSNDLSWRMSKKSYEEKYNLLEQEDNGEERYRDWEIFKYWFRAVEEYAPWVNKVYLVTCGHIPDWINIECKKLKVVSHSEFMPSEYLPTFSSIPIELNLHRISGLSEQFVYFNDDMFLTRPVNPEDFFINGVPKHCAIMYPLRNDIENDSFKHQLFSVLGMLNEVFASQLSATIKNNSEKWFSYQYGKAIKYNLQAFDASYIGGLWFSHLGVPFRKSTFEKVWNVLEKKLKETCIHKFRAYSDINHQIFSAWDILSGDFLPVSQDYYGKVFASLNNQINEIEEAIIMRKYKMICLNDSKNIGKVDFVESKKKIINIMQKAFPRKSEYEL